MRVIVCEKSSPWGPASYLSFGGTVLVCAFAVVVAHLYSFEGVRDAGMTRARGLRAEADRKVRDL